MYAKILSSIILLLYAVICVNAKELTGVFTSLGIVPGEHNRANVPTRSWDATLDFSFTTAMNATTDDTFTLNMSDVLCLQLSGGNLEVTDDSGNAIFNCTYTRGSFEDPGSLLTCNVLSSFSTASGSIKLSAIFGIGGTDTDASMDLAKAVQKGSYTVDWDGLQDTITFKLPATITNGYTPSQVNYFKGYDLNFADIGYRDSYYLAPYCANYAYSPTITIVYGGSPSPMGDLESCDSITVFATNSLSDYYVPENAIDITKTVTCTDNTVKIKATSVPAGYHVVVVAHQDINTDVAVSDRQFDNKY